jgi:hypothetical protein
VKTRRLIAALVLLPALGCGYLAGMAWKVGDESKWLFLVCAAFFLVPGVALLFPPRKPGPETEATGTRFAPHWVLLLGLLAIVFSAIAAIVGAFLKR